MARAGAVAALLLLAAGCATASVCDTYIVQAGDTISSIAAQFNVLESDLQDALTKCIRDYTPGVFLQPKQIICLPTWYDACANVVAADGGDTTGAYSDCKYYKIQAGDTLDTIASSLGLTLLGLQAVNQDSSTLAVGQYVKLPGWWEGCPAPGNTAQACRYYVAEASDSLASIALAFSVKLDDIKATNADLTGDTSSVLQPGQHVKIPPFTSDCGEGVEVPKPASGTCNVYRVQAGDTLYNIAASFGTTTTELVAINPNLAAGGVLSTDTEVFIPPYSEEGCVDGKTYVTPTYTYSPEPSDGSIQAQSLDTAPAPSGEAAPGPVAAAPAPAPAEAGRRLLRA
ncbi:hypothetical protein ABPG75_007155 [Micractinium tetrahymenae]